ncbi:Uncharacterized membrane-anchored protein [Pseudomonas linyingensis]|jgi:uncharacterized membrane-anchored protein|uniref:Uncharacterized membrane-anchored protein n=1 Tax=Pseudomonas linyingensis TaxID=915471 RepID=A0A1H7AEG2_9PSED|nr:DUF3422 domain-containing protein [Pseudomonas linyingensis]SEJ62277.1 Uncharacterized membrane-anchored protein [Pseudomonas linyingensis]
MHPLRTTLHNELHSRPSIYFREPSHVYHLAFVDAEQACDELIGQLGQLASDVLPGNGMQGLLRLDAATLKWERHSEFFTLTLVLPRPAQGAPWPPLPEPWAGLIEAHRPLLISAVQVLVEAERDWAGAATAYGFKDPAGSHLGDGDATAWSDFRLDDNGVNRILLVNRRLNAYRLGRIIRRLLEIETYRMMASLTLPVAQEVSLQLKDYDRELASLSDRNAEGSDSAKVLSAAIAQLSARIVSCSVRTRQRFGATAAYAQIVFERIAELREGHVDDCQRLGVFIERRFRPTVRYCAATDQRLERLGQSVANLGDLLQARVQVEVEEQNSAILHSLNARADTQIRIQKAVEGLSIIAISYYLLSLFKLLYQGLHGLGLDISVRSAMLGMGPLALLILLGIMRRIRQARQH